jgi:hypothetical protein
MKKEPTQKQIVKKDIGDYSALEAVQKTEGGKLIIASLKKDIMSALDSLSRGYKEISHAELIVLCAKFSERLTLYRMIARSSKNKKLAMEELENLLDEPED